LGLARVGVGAWSKEAAEWVISRCKIPGSGYGITENPFPPFASSLFFNSPLLLPLFFSNSPNSIQIPTYPSLFVTRGFRPRPPVTFPYNLRSRRRIIDPISVYHNCTMVWYSAIIIGSPDRLSAIKHTQTNLAAHSLWRCLQCQSITKLLELKTSLTEHNHL